MSSLGDFYRTGNSAVNGSEARKMKDNLIYTTVNGSIDNSEEASCLHFLTLSLFFCVKILT